MLQRGGVGGNGEGGDGGGRGALHLKNKHKSRRKEDKWRV